MPEKDNIVIDMEKMQIDRSTPIGQSFAKMQEVADKEPDPDMRNLMNQLLAFSEACIVIDETVDNPRDKSRMLSQLRSKAEVK